VGEDEALGHAAGAVVGLLEFGEDGVVGDEEEVEFALGEPHLLVEFAFDGVLDVGGLLHCALEEGCAPGGRDLVGVGVETALAAVFSGGEAAGGGAGTGGFEGVGAVGGAAAVGCVEERH
jgi:hypothetical protein